MPKSSHPFSNKVHGGLSAFEIVAIVGLVTILLVLAGPAIVRAYNQAQADKCQRNRQDIAHEVRMLWTQHIVQFNSVPDSSQRKGMYVEYIDDHEHECPGGGHYRIRSTAEAVEIVCPNNHGTTVIKGVKTDNRPADKAHTVTAKSSVGSAGRSQIRHNSAIDRTRNLI